MVRHGLLCQGACLAAVAATDLVDGVSGAATGPPTLCAVHLWPELPGQAREPHHRLEV